MSDEDDAKLIVVLCEIIWRFLSGWYGGDTRLIAVDINCFRLDQFYFIQNEHVIMLPASKVRPCASSKASEQPIYLAFMSTFYSQGTMP